MMFNADSYCSSRGVNIQRGALLNMSHHYYHESFVIQLFLLLCFGFALDVPAS